VIHEVLSQNKMIIESPEPFVRLSSHGATSQNFTIRVWVLSVDYWDVHFTLIEALKEAFDLAGIEVPLPRLVINQNGEI
jgi:small conductance mechanosensitive channel